MVYRKRGPKKPKDTLGRLMIELRTRSKIWVPCSPERSRVIRAALTEAISLDLGRAVYDLAPDSETTARVSEIVQVQFFASKTPAETPEEEK